MDKKTIESLAYKELYKQRKENNKFTFPIDPFKIIYSNNIVTVFSEFDKLEGILLYNNSSKSLISINKSRPIQRQRFTAAHELGHYFMHIKEEEINFVCEIKSKKVIEKEADEFASYLLMPTFELKKQIDKYANDDGRVSLESVVYIAEYFGVSFESCTNSIAYRLNRLEGIIESPELRKRISQFKPSKKREVLIKTTNDLQLLRSIINYSYFSTLNMENIEGIKVIQDIIYNESIIENSDIDIELVKEIYADFRINGHDSKYCNDQNSSIIEILGNIEMNRYCLDTDDKIDIYKIKDLHKLLYKYSPFPEFSGEYKIVDNIILGGNSQPTKITDLPNELKKINDILVDIINNIDDYEVDEYIEKVAKIHYELTKLHPFPDGNGRVARSFLNWMLRLKKLPPIYITIQEKKEYLNALHKMDDSGDSTILQILIIKACIRTMTILNRKCFNVVK